MTPIRAQLLVTLLLLFEAAASEQSRQALRPRTVEIASGDLRLKAFLWTPPGKGPFPAVLFNHGSGEVDSSHTAGMLITEAAAELAPHFIEHGYAFLFLFRRGQGLSADQAPWLQERLHVEDEARGREARDQLQFQLLTTEQLDDVMAALSFLKTVPKVDPHRIAIVGHSFGGQLTLLATQRDRTVRAAVTFGAAAASWERSPKIRELLQSAVGETNTTPIMLTHAANDYSTAAGRALTEERQRQHKPVLLRIYPAVGQTPDDGHNMIYGGIPLWESDVFQFLDENVKR